MTDHNPYAPPETSEPDQGALPGVPRDNREQLPPEAIDGTALPRFVASQLDFIAVSFAAVLLAKQIPLELVWFQILTAVIAVLGYFFLTEYYLGQTLGKMFAGIKVISLDGEPCSAWQILVRTLLRVIEANPLLLGAILAGISAMISPTNQRIADRLVGTTVVRQSYNP